MTKKRKRPHTNNVQPIPSTQLNVKQIEKQLSRDSERALAGFTWKETNARNTLAKSSEALSQLHKRCSSDSQTGTFSHQNRDRDGETPKQAEDNRSSETWHQGTTPSNKATCPLDSKQFRLQSTSCTFDRNVNAGRSERTKSRDLKGKCCQCKVGRPTKTCKTSEDQVIKLPVIPVLKISLTDVKSLNDSRVARKYSSSRYRVTPYPFGESPPLKKRHRAIRTSRSRSGSSCKSCSSEGRRRQKHHRPRRRRRAWSSSSISSCMCRCCCSSCQTCTQKTYRRSRSNSEEHKRRKKGSLEKCCRSRQHSEQPNSIESSPKGTPTEKTRQSPDATKTVKNIIERFSNAFSRKEDCKHSNDRVRKKISSDNGLEQEKVCVSRKSRSRSPERRHNRKRPSTRKNNDSNMMCRLM